MGINNSQSRGVAVVGSLTILKDESNYFYCEVNNGGKKFKVGPFDKKLQLAAMGFDFEIIIRESGQCQKLA